MVAFQGLVTFTLDRVILHTVMHHSSSPQTFLYLPNAIEIVENFCGRTDGHLRSALLGRHGGVDLTKVKYRNFLMDIGLYPSRPS